MPRVKTRFVVRRGRTSVGGELGEVEGLERENRREGGAKREMVPVPVRSGRIEPRSRMSRMRERYCSSSCGATGVLPLVWGVLEAAIQQSRSLVDAVWGEQEQREASSPST